jgi:hypothetical protein
MTHARRFRNRNKLEERAGYEADHTGYVIAQKAIIRQGYLGIVRVSFRLRRTYQSAVSASQAGRRRARMRA